MGWERQEIKTATRNTEFKGMKSDGVSVRAGGLVGSMRGNITSCYTGGEINANRDVLLMLAAGQAVM